MFCSLTQISNSHATICIFQSVHLAVGDCNQRRQEENRSTQHGLTRSAGFAGGKTVSHGERESSIRHRTLNECFTCAFAVPPRRNSKIHQRFDECFGSKAVSDQHATLWLAWEAARYLWYLIGVFKMTASFLLSSAFKDSVVPNKFSFGGKNARPQLPSPSSP